MDYKNCKQCNKQFEPQVWNQLYCRPRCRYTHWNNKAQRLPVGLSEEQRKQVEAIIAKKKLRDIDSDALESV